MANGGRRSAQMGDGHNGDVESIRLAQMGDGHNGSPARGLLWRHVPCRAILRGGGPLQDLLVTSGGPLGIP